MSRWPLDVQRNYDMYIEMYDPSDTAGLEKFHKLFVTTYNAWIHAHTFKQYCELGAGYFSGRYLSIGTFSLPFEDHCRIVNDPLGFSCIPPQYGPALEAINRKGLLTFVGQPGIPERQRAFVFGVCTMDMARQLVHEFSSSDIVRVYPIVSDKYTHWPFRTTKVLTNKDPPNAKSERGYDVGTGNRYIVGPMWDIDMLEQDIMKPKAARTLVQTMANGVSYVFIGVVDRVWGRNTLFERMARFMK